VAVVFGPVFVFVIDEFAAFTVLQSSLIGLEIIAELKLVIVLVVTAVGATIPIELVFSLKLIIDVETCVTVFERFIFARVDR